MRQAGAVIALALLAAAVLIAGWGRTLGQAHAAGTCVEHTKRVVKHVKRHGKRTRVVRPRHYWTCEEAPAPSAPASSPAPTPAAPGAPTPSPPTAPLPAPVIETPKTEVPPQPEPEPNAVSVTATDEPGDFAYTPSRTTVRSGKLTVELNNQGMDAHNMYMQRVGPGGEPEEELIKVSQVTPSTKQTVKTVEVQAGTYRMWCSFENGKHAEEGMETHITVAG